MILTLDLGTSYTKACLWDRGLLATGRVALRTRHPAPGRAEQDPADWWASAVEAAAAARQAADLVGTAPVTAVACTGARQTFATVGADGSPTGPGILWSDRRGASEVGAVAARAGGAAAVRRSTGAPLAAESVAAKLAWLSAHAADQLRRARWLLTPRDLVVWRLCGACCTDQTMASRSGLYDLDGRVVEDLAGAAVGRLPPVVASDEAVGTVAPGAADELGVPPGIPVVIGAGDRASEVVGVGASPTEPMVSWGTTASVVVPTGTRPPAVPEGLVLSRAATEGWLVEGGLSAAGALIDWLGALTGRSVPALLEGAARRPPGANGVVALPWLGGARAPWWRDGAGAGFVGARADHDASDLARAAVEAVAADVRRCLAAVSSADGGPSDAAGPRPLPFDGLALAGRGSAGQLWPSVLAGICALGVRTRQSGEAASAGAAWLAARAVGDPVDLDALDPRSAELAADPAVVEAYRRWWPEADPVARALVDLDLGGRSPGGDGTGVG